MTLQYTGIELTYTLPDAVRAKLLAAVKAQGNDARLEQRYNSTAQFLFTAFDWTKDYDTLYWIDLHRELQSGEVLSEEFNPTTKIVIHDARCLEGASVNPQNIKKEGNTPYRRRRFIE
tara:strand:+ start:1106 stop:1459 length:354 start_codon:yes stop_codon:yes gene_type:complete